MVAFIIDLLPRDMIDLEIIFLKLTTPGLIENKETSSKATLDSDGAFITYPFCRRSDKADDYPARIMDNDTLAAR